jgi:hypothetical protein
MKQLAKDYSDFFDVFDECWFPVEALRGNQYRNYSN